MAASNRSLYFDNVKFILIFLVVFGHVISPLKEGESFLYTLYSFIFLFHMPAFIMISGYFSKGYQKKVFFLRSIKKILVPYLIFQMIYSVFYYLNGDEEKLAFNLLEPHWTLWFLLSLFCWNSLLFVFGKWRWKGLLIAVILGVLVGYYEGIGSYLSLSRTFVFFPYFLLGFLLNKEHMRKIVRSKLSVPLGIGVLVCTFALFAWNSSLIEESVSWLLGNASYASMGIESAVGGFIRLGQYFMTALVIFSFLALIPSKGFSVTMIGQRTLYVYLLHGFIIKIIETLVPDETLSSYSGHYILLLMFSLVICLILGSYFIKKYTSPLIELKNSAA
nr:acyltransferase family protein [Peribacillus kribbensis]